MMARRIIAASLSLDIPRRARLCPLSANPTITTGRRAKSRNSNSYVAALGLDPGNDGLTTHRRHLVLFLGRRSIPQDALGSADTALRPVA